jgi:hypothetical protein
VAFSFQELFAITQAYPMAPLFFHPAASPIKTLLVMSRALRA